MISYSTCVANIKQGIANNIKRLRDQLFNGGLALSSDSDDTSAHRWEESY
jgi:hypothetical protein